MLGELTAPAVLDLTTAAPRRAPSRVPSDYSVLMAQVRAARLLERSVVGYLPRGLVLTAMVAAGVTAFCWLGDSWWQLAVAAYFAVVFAQIGFLGHDAGHQQVFRSRRRNDNLGMLLSNLGIGISYAWWVEKHNRHHRHPNDPDLDPDVERNVLAWTAEQADRQRGALRFVARHQAGLFFPLLLLEAVNLHIGSVRTLLDAKNRRRPAEFVLLAVHVAAGITVLLLFLSPLKALGFLAVQQFLFGLYLGCSFAPNHKGMPMIGRGAPLDFLRRQVLTSRNVRGGRAMAAVFGGLNYQIEHHLFPCMPSRNLRRCRPLVMSFCAAQDIAYTESSLLGSYARALCALGAVRPVSS